MSIRYSTNEFLNSVFGIISYDKQFKQLYELKITERTNKLYCELSIHDYKDLLKSHLNVSLNAFSATSFASRNIFSASALVET